MNKGKRRGTQIIATENEQRTKKKSMKSYRE
jgi:hypothetical protein